MTAVPLVFSPSKTAAAAAAFGGIQAGTGGTTVSTSAPPPPSTPTVNVWDVDIPSGCLPDITAVTVSAVYTKSAGVDVAQDGGVVFVGDTATGAPWGTITAPSGDVGAAFPPGYVSRDYVFAGGTLAVSGDPIGGTWSDPAPPTVLQVAVIADTDQTSQLGIYGETVSVSLPTIDVTFAPGSPCAAVVPITVDDTATTPVNVPVVVSVGTNDDPSPCAPGCMVHREALVDFVDPASTATGIVASVDAAGVATVQAATPGTAIIHTESGCSPSCDANGTDVVVWTTQTLTVTVTPAVTPGPCVEVPVTFSQVDTDAIGAAFGIDPTTDPTSVEADADIGGKQTIGVWLIELPEGCDAEVVSVQAAATVDISATMDPDEDGAFIAVVDSIVPPTGWGTLAATSGDPNIQLPGSLSTGYTSSGGTAWPAGPTTVTLDGTWTAGTLPASTLALLVYADALGTGPSGSNIRVNVPETVCVTFANPCGPPDPIPVDDTANTTTGTTITVDAAANDNNTPCDPLPGCAVYRESMPFIDPGSTATGITASIDAAGEVTFTASGPGVAVLNVESGCSPTCDPNGADVTTWVSQTVTITVTEPVVPCPTQLVKNCLAETPIVGCAEYAGVPAATVLHSVTGINGDVIPVGSTGFPAANGVGSDGSGFIRSYFTDLTGTVVTPDTGTFTAGDCPTAAPSMTFTAAGVSIASGVHAATLGPDGTTWVAPSGLRSLTVAARRTNTTDATNGAANRVEIVGPGGTFRLLEGETFTWSVDDPDSFTLTSVTCVGDAAAAVVWVAL
jgi:hypothetical protein